MRAGQAIWLTVTFLQLYLEVEVKGQHLFRDGTEETHAVIKMLLGLSVFLSCAYYPETEGVFYNFLFYCKFSV